MLLLAAALLTASIHTRHVIEPPTVPTVAVSSAAVAPRVAESGADRTHIADSSNTTTLRGTSLHGTSLLAGLADLSSAGLRAAAAEAPVRAAVLDDPPSARSVEDWWAVLPAPTRARLVADAPQLVGNLEGVPYAVRDRANRAFLRTAIGSADVHGSATAAKAAMLGQIRDSLVRAPGTPQKLLLTIDTRGAGRAAIAIGDLQSASDVTVMVPGMFFTVTGQMTDWTATAGDIYAEEATAASSASTTTADGTSGVAVLAWMGYRTPDMSNILSLDLARVGATRLERVVNGLDTLRAVDRPRVSIVAHSYGSTTALFALSSGRMSADSLTLLGSPGSTVRHASQLSVPRGQVYVGDAHWDPVAGTGFFGPDPGSATFGSTLIDLAGGPDPTDADVVFRQPFGHNDYLKPGTASLHDVALIGVGRGDLVKRSTDPTDPSGNGDSGSPDFLLVRPQDLQQRD